MAQINNSRAAYDAVKELLRFPTQEEVFMITLDNMNNLMAIHFVALGSDTCATFPIKEICRHAILDIACNVILVHTHPHGDPTPSSADIKSTEDLHKALAVFNIPLLDHIVIGKDRFYSFTDETVILV